MINVALLGNPNVGKTTVFNLLTGSNQYVGNWYGVTIEKRRISWKRDKGCRFTWYICNGYFLK